MFGLVYDEVRNSIILGKYLCKYSSKKTSETKPLIREMVAKRLGLTREDSSKVSDKRVTKCFIIHVNQLDELLKGWI